MTLYIPKFRRNVVLVFIQVVLSRFRNSMRWMGSIRIRSIWSCLFSWKISSQIMLLQPPLVLWFEDLFMESSCSTCSTSISTRHQANFTTTSWLQYPPIYSDTWDCPCARDETPTVPTLLWKPNLQYQETYQRSHQKHQFQVLYYHTKSQKVCEQLFWMRWGDWGSALRGGRRRFNAETLGKEGVYGWYYDSFQPGSRVETNWIDTQSIGWFQLLCICRCVGIGQSFLGQGQRMWIRSRIRQ